MPRLSIIIVSYNSIADLAGCLRSLTDPPPAIDHEIVVVDNASTDGTPDYLRRHWPAIHLVDAGGNLGFARANNLGVRQTSGDLVLLLNPDTVVPRGGIDRLVAALAADPDAAVAGPRIVDANGRAELSWGRMIAPLAEARQKLCARMPAVVERLTSTSRHVDWVSGACLLIWRRDLEAAGGLDERFFMYTEDVDLCAAVRARGRKVLFSTATEVVHLRGRSVTSAPAATEAAYRRSQIAFYDKHHPAWAPLLRAYLKFRGKLPDRSGSP